jgi:tetratricopeptide (TPR) repeat protein
VTAVGDDFQAAFAHHQRGELEQAKAIYRRIVERQPGHADAWHLLGLVSHQQGRNDEAVELISRAISINGSQGGYHNHLGAVQAVLGKLDQAEASFRRALQLSAVDPQVHYNLAALLNLQGRPEEAIEHYRRAIELNPRMAEAHFNLGNLLRERQDWIGAEQSYAAALAARPNYVKALTSLASVRLKLNKLDESEAAWRQVIQLDPRHVEAHFRLGSALQSRGRLEEAISFLRTAALLDQHHFEAQNNLGCAHRSLGQMDEAIACFQLAIHAKSDFAEAYCNLGSVLHEKKDLPAAENYLRKSLELRPDFAGALSNLGAVLQGQKRYQEAEQTYRQGLALDPDLPDLLVNLGSCLAVQGKAPEAIEILTRSVALNGASAPARYSLAAALHMERQEDAALAEYNAAIEIKPDYAEAYYNRSFVHLSRGDFAAGWRDYEWRLRCKDYKPRRFDVPQWDGSPLEGRTLLVHAEQGLGDTLHFARYLKLVQARGDAVYFQVPKVLIPLLKTSGFTGIVGGGEPLPRFDLHVPLLSLPGLFNTTMENIPAKVPYLAADPKLLKTWRTRLRATPGLRIGIVWQGNPSYTFDQFRSVPLAQFEPLAQVNGVQLISLQKQAGVEQITTLAGRFTVIDLGDDLDTGSGPFMDTAAVMCNLDLVVTSDTAAAHLAGGLGVEVWVATSAAPEWRWMYDRADCPWYPTMRLFRQPRLGDWASVFRDMQSELSKRVAPERAR